MLWPVSWRESGYLNMTGASAQYRACCWENGTPCGDWRLCDPVPRTYELFGTLMTIGDEASYPGKVVECASKSPFSFSSALSVIAASL